MAVAFLDVCRFKPVAGGLADFVFATPVDGYVGPALAVDGFIYRYRAESRDQLQWELGYGAQVGGTFARTTIVQSSNANAKVDFTEIPVVGIVWLAEDMPGAPAPAASAFRADPNSNDVAGIASGAVTKIGAAHAPVNAGGYFNTTTQRWVPRAGSVIMTVAALMISTSNGFTAGKGCTVWIYKNGAPLVNHSDFAAATNLATSGITAADVANGTDYYEAFVHGQISAGTLILAGDPVATFFSGIVF